MTNSCGKNYKCCWISQCAHVQHGRCPGGTDVKCFPRTNTCHYFKRGKCPGGTDYRKLGEPYKDSKGKVVRCS
jgi:hypothetical protein